MSFITPIGGPCGSLVNNPIPLYPPVFIEGDRDRDRRGRRDRDDNREVPGISANIASGQTTSGTLQLAGTNFADGAIRLAGNSIHIRRGGRYIVDLNVTVNYPVAGNNSAFFSVSPGPGSYIAGGSYTGTGSQVYSGSTVIEIGDGTSISITATLNGATVQGGTLVVQMVPGTGLVNQF